MIETNSVFLRLFKEKTSFIWLPLVKKSLKKKILMSIVTVQTHHWLCSKLDRSANLKLSKWEKDLALWRKTHNLKCFSFVTSWRSFSRRFRRLFWCEVKKICSFWDGVGRTSSRKIEFEKYYGLNQGLILLK